MTSTHSMEDRAALMAALAPGLPPCRSRPVLVPRELLAAFDRARGITASFGDGCISIADHCLQTATALHEAAWVPDIYRRDMVVMALFHDIYYDDSATDHGKMAASLLEGRIHPHVLRLLEHHIELSHDHKLEDTALFSVPTFPMLDKFCKLDCSALKQGGRSFSMAHFQALGYFDAEPDNSIYRSTRKRLPWLSPNATLVWAAPSMWIERVPLLLAQKLHLFQAAGLPPVELRITDGGPELIEQIRAGDVHIGEIGLFPFLVASKEGAPALPAKLVGSSFIQQLDHYIVTRGPEVDSLEDLRGRKVGVLSNGSCDSHLLKMMLAMVGLDVSDIVEVPLRADYGKAEVLQEGRVDALFLVEPSLTKAEELGIAKVLLKASSVYPRFQWGALFASDCLREEGTDVLLRLLGVYEAACRGMVEALAESAAPEALTALGELGPEWFGVSPETFLRALRRDAATWQMQWRSVDFEGVQACIDMQRDMGVLPVGTGLTPGSLFCEKILGKP